MSPLSGFWSYHSEQNQAHLTMEKIMHKTGVKFEVKICLKAKVTYGKQWSDLLVYPSRQYFEPRLAGFAG